MHETVVGAGCVVLRHGKQEPEVLLIWTKQYPDPTLPKGHLEPSESERDCAVREVEEETGFAVDVLTDESIAIATVLDKHPPIVHKTIHWFPARVTGGAPEKRLEQDLISKVGWLPISEAVAQMCRSDEIQAVHDCLSLVKRSGLEIPAYVSA